MEEILRALAEITQAYRDTRIHYCRLDAVALDGERCILTGVVLDAATLAGVRAGLIARLPGLTFDANRVHILCGDASHVLTVATNLTGLYAGSSFLAEQMSQLLNGWPVEVLLEEGRWCFVRQADGYLGWAYRPYLAEVAAPASTHIIYAPEALLRDAPFTEAPAIQRILGGTAVTAQIKGAWAYVTLAGDPTAPLRSPLTGWAPAAELRALAALPADEASRRKQIVDDAARFVGVPYLWGGCTAFGIDCSGYAQLLHRLAGVTIPRDADQQFEAGKPVEAPYRPGDLLFFGEGDATTRKITHVGVSLGGWRIIHSSRSRNGVHEDDVRAVEHLRESFIGARSFVCPV